MTTEEIAYNEGVRAIESQSKTLDELRGRTSYLLAAGGIIAAFFGPFALDDGPGILGGAAVIVFAVVAGVCLWILIPRSEAWIFGLQPRLLLEDHTDVPERNDP